MTKSECLKKWHRPNFIRVAPAVNFLFRDSRRSSASALALLRRHFTRPWRRSWQPCSKFIRRRGLGRRGRSCRIVSERRDVDNHDFCLNNRHLACGWSLGHSGLRLRRRLFTGGLRRRRFRRSWRGRFVAVFGQRVAMGGDERRSRDRLFEPHPGRFVRAVAALGRHQSRCANGLAALGAMPDPSHFQVDPQAGAFHVN